MGIHNFEGQLISTEDRIRDAEYSQRNKDILFRFENHLFAEGLKTPSILKHLKLLNLIAQWIDGDLDMATKDDIASIVARVERSDMSELTKRNYKASIKKFYSWMEMDYLTSWFKTNIRKGSSKLPEELLTESDIKKMIDISNHPRDKAIISVLYDTGVRIGEMGYMKIKHVSFDQYGAVITVKGKTGMRRVRIIFSVPYLAAWLDVHPQKNDPDAYLWVGLGNRAKREQLQYDAFRMLIKRKAREAGIRKRVYNHLFRHSRSTELAQHLTEAQMEAHLGWVHGSDMPRTYVHLSGKQVDDALLKIHGIIKEEDTRPQLSSRKCPRCERMNTPTSSFCSRCGMALDMETAASVEEKRSDVAMKLMELVENEPELARLLNQRFD